MANFFENKDRNIIPTWRSFENTAKLGELNGSKSIKLDSSFKPDISDLLDDWIENQTIALAGDIIGVALVCNQETNHKVQEIAKFVLSNKDNSSKAIFNAALTILKPKKEEIQLNQDISQSDFGSQANLVEIYLKINKLKKSLINNPYNAIYWVELARFYSIIGQDSKALKAVRNALYLSPDNRFILRSCARFFIHIGSFDIAHDIVRKSPLTRHDPWLLATEIGLATLRERNSIFTKHGLEVVNSNSFHPFNISELASSIATVELQSNLNKSRKLFEKSLVNPNDNSLAQAEWASQKERKLINVNPEEYKLVNSFEASAREFFDRSEWQHSIDSSREWFFDQPFSKLAVLYGNEVASRKLRDEAQAIEIAKLGLLSHPNDAHLINNIIYGLCILNKTDEAEKYFNLIKKDDEKESTEICLTATRGLWFFRKGLHDLGRKFYLEAINMAKEINSKYYTSVAYINYLREEMLIGEDIADAIPQLEQIMKNTDNDDVRSDAEEVLKLYLKNKN